MRETKGLYSGRINLLNHFWFTAFIFWLIFTYNTAIESYEHVDYAGLKNEGSRAKMTKNIEPSAVRGSPLRTYSFIFQNLSNEILDLDPPINAPAHYSSPIFMYNAVLA